MKILKFIWIVLCAPGYAQLWLQYNSPIEWGKKRNAAETARKWKNRHWFAPILSIIWYFAIYLMGGHVLVSHYF